MSEVIRDITFDVEKDEDGFWCAAGREASVFTNAKSIETLRSRIVEAVKLHFEDEPAELRPTRIRLRIVAIEEMPVEELAA